MINTKKKQKEQQISVSKVNIEIPSLIKVHIYTSQNNTIITLTDETSTKVFYISSCGKLKIRGTKKSTQYSSQQVCWDVLKWLEEKNVNNISIYINGVSFNREIILNTFVKAKDMIVHYLIDVTPIVHNGCKPRKRRKK